MNLNKRSTAAETSQPEIPPPPERSTEVRSDQPTDHPGQPIPAALSERLAASAVPLDQGKVSDDYETVAPQPRRQRRQVELLSLTTIGMSSSEILPGTSTESAQPSDAESSSANDVADLPSTSGNTAFSSGALAPKVSDFSVEKRATSEGDDEDDGTKNKGKGKGRNENRMRASDVVRMKSKEHMGVLTRRREKLMREQEEQIHSSMAKLMVTGKKMVNRDISLEDWSEPSDSSNPLSDFSSHDLIRNRVSEPQNFDEPIVSNCPDNEIHVIANPNPQSTVAETSSIWNLSLNPFSYYRRGQNESGRVDSIPDDANIDPQHSSTPN